MSRGPIGAGSDAAQRTWGILKSGDFAAVLATVPLAKSMHFVIQHLPGGPASAVRITARGVVQELSTVHAPLGSDSVDNTSSGTPSWLGLVIPKRHAKRAVTRNLLKRQMRIAITRHDPRMPPGQWVIRLRAPFDVRVFPSAASEALREAARLELEQLFSRAVAK